MLSSPPSSRRRLTSVQTNKHVPSSHARIHLTPGAPSLRSGLSFLASRLSLRYRTFWPMNGEAGTAHPLASAPPNAPAAAPPPHPYIRPTQLFSGSSSVSFFPLTNTATNPTALLCFSHQQTATPTPQTHHHIHRQDAQGELSTGYTVLLAVHYNALAYHLKQPIS